MIKVMDSYKDFDDKYWIHELRVKNVFLRIKDRLMPDIIISIFSMWNIRASVSKSNELDLILIDNYADENPEQSINKAKYILKRLNDLLKLELNIEPILNETQTSFGETDLEILDPMLKEITRDNARFIIGLKLKKTK